MPLKMRIEIQENQIRILLLGNGKQIASLNEENESDTLNALKTSLEKTAVKTRRELPALMKRVQRIEIKTDMAERILLEKDGSRVGVLVTAGYENMLVNGKGTDLISEIAQPGLVIGIHEKIDAKGTLIREPEEEAIREAVRGLLDGGSEIIIASLKNSEMNPHNETFCQSVKAKNFPGHYLGGVPFQKSIEVSTSSDFASRTRLAFVNAYIKSTLASRLYALSEMLREMEHRHPLHILDSGRKSKPLAKILPAMTLGRSIMAQLKITL